ncbi:hypothetical protein F5050DRAFT_1714270 [Lentinula boryana]|uniref:Uncharacterized protein n=1 Tax=Lentinula boryana TaxID=40481 RepID=A0ABQ8Q5E8_9AGAR|nr:hypothetical protein F5050DRAFT_1714270 [Lentinula boryana]
MVSRAMANERESVVLGLQLVVSLFAAANSLTIDSLETVSFWLDAQTGMHGVFQPEYYCENSGTPIMERYNQVEDLLWWLERRRLEALLFVQDLQWGGGVWRFGDEFDGNIEKDKSRTTLK